MKLLGSLLTVIAILGVCDPRGTPATITGAGGRTCLDWTTDQRDQGALWGVDEAWLAGHLSASGQDSELRKNPDAGAREAWVTNYCQTHPLDLISEATDALIIELKAHKHRPDALGEHGIVHEAPIS